MAVQIQLRNDTAANWTTENPTLAAGEVGVETDTGSVKVGDGTTAWTSLGYFGVGSAYVDTAVANLVDSAPATLDTLNELAAALGDDANFATTVTDSLASKTDKLQTISAKTANYTLQQSDNQALISCDGTFTITLPTLSAGTRIDILNVGTGTISFNNNAGAPFINGAEFTGFPSIDTQWAAASVLYLSSSNAAIVGKIA